MCDKRQMEEMVRLRRDIHQHPETGFDVFRTAKIAAECMKEAGLLVKEEVGRTGVVADLEVPGASKRIALRADMDALPIQEERKSSYQSTVPGKAHLCGHDAHTAMLIGAAKYLASRKESLDANVRFIFQPSEEVDGGAQGMIEEGCLDGVDAIFALHVWPWLATGSIGICADAAMAQYDAFDITIHGKGGHAAAPHQNIDPIVIGSHLVAQLQTLVSRYTNPLHPVVISVTTFHAGSAYNVIPSEARLSGTVRTYDLNTQVEVKAGMERMIRDTVSAFGAQASFDYKEGYPPVINHQIGNDAVYEAASAFLPKENVIYPAEKAMFGEDFAYYLQHVPGTFIHLGCRNEELDCVYPLHHPKFNLDEACLKVGMRLFANLIPANQGKSKDSCSAGAISLKKN